MSNMQRNVYHLSHKRNFESIICRGLLSRNELIAKKHHHEDISLRSVQNKRVRCLESSERPSRVNVNCYIHDFIPLFFRTRTPMLWAVKSKCLDLFFIEFDLDKLQTDPDIRFIFSDGNIASEGTKIYSDSEWSKQNHKIDWRKIDRYSWWKNRSEAARQISAEFLVYKTIPISYVKRIIVPNQLQLIYYQTILNDHKTEISIDINAQTFLLD
tara:strand:+ start:168 stop:806 length:639 start_codon:yes stop_codon:yes gene_type:complete